MVAGDPVCCSSLWVKDESAGVSGCTAVLPQFYFNLMLLTESSHFRLAFQNINRRLDQVNNPVCACIRFWQGKFFG